MKKQLAALAAGTITLYLGSVASAEPMPTFTSITPQGPVVNLTVSDFVEVAPDIATISISIYNRNRDKALGMQENRAKSAKVMEALKAAGVSDADIETQWFNVGDEFDYLPSGTRRRKGYVVSNNLTAKVRKLDGLSDLISSVSLAGASNVGSPDFDVENKTPFIEKLTRSATDKARLRAEFHARLNAFTGIKLVSVSDEVVGGPNGGGEFASAPMRLQMPMDAASAAAEAAPDIRPAQVNIGVKLYMTFEMTK